MRRTGSNDILPKWDRMNVITQKIFEDVGTLPREMQEEILNFVQFLKSKLRNPASEPKQTESNGRNIARLLEEASKKHLFSHIDNPAEWQREMRKERSLPGRES